MVSIDLPICTLIVEVIDDLLQVTFQIKYISSIVGIELATSVSISMVTNEMSN
jgi:hypothetical protein